MSSQIHSAIGRNTRILALLGSFFVPSVVFAQNCALCYTQAASAGHRMIEALRSGILILIVPPTFMSVCMIFIMRHKHNQFRDDEAGTDAASDYPNREW